MNRRGFLGSILAASIAPAIVRADSLMRVVPMETFVIPSAASWRGAIRELYAFDIGRDVMLYRWDVAGYVGGVLSQVHVTIKHEYTAIPPLVTSVNSPQAILCAASPRAQGVDAVRERALVELRQRVEAEGMLVSSGILELPHGMATARFLG